MEKAFETAKPSTLSSSSSKPSTSAAASTSGAKRKADETATKGGPSAPKKGLWIGDGLTESDLEDSSDEEEAEKVEEKGISK